MYIYLLYDSCGDFLGAYKELEHAYMRMLKVWLHFNFIDDIEYYDKQCHLNVIEDDWLLYKVPIGEHEEVYIPTKSKNSTYLIELPKTYGDLRCAIRDFRINELTK